MIRTEINESATVIGRRQTEIDAPAEHVWDVLTAVESWPAWNPDVKSVSLEGEIAEGKSFRWKAGPGTITSTVRQIDAPRRIAWTGKTLGINATHVYRLEGRNGKTLVRTEESYEGLVARVLRGSLQKTLDNALEQGLAHLKGEVERRERS
jgi:uncharacterized protein YndB with AHSA1/START domain